MKHITHENFKQEVETKETPTLIDFWAPWCGPCNMMGPVFEELSKEYKDKLEFAKVNTDEEPMLSSHFGVQGIPCLILTKDGKEIDRIVGFAPKEELKRKIDNIMQNV